MYLRPGIRPKHLFHNSWRFVLLITLWSTLVVYVHEFRDFEAIGMPILPVTTIGIAVSLYLGFKSSSAYKRWWEARTIWGDIINDSRNWANHVLSLIYDVHKDVDPTLAKEFVYRHLAWVNALAHQMRRPTRLKESRSTHTFDHRRVFEDLDFHQNPESFEKFLSHEERAYFSQFANPATQILRKQGERIREVLRDGHLDSYRHVEMMRILGQLYHSQGGCERIKNTPFPRQIANFGLIFTWSFIFLLPLAFVGVFDSTTEALNMSELLTHEYMFTMVPFTVLISWIFFLMEKVSDSTEDPFEGGATDVPISAICRIIEIDLKQMVGEQDVPEPLQPVDGVLY